MLTRSPKDTNYQQYDSQYQQLVTNVEQCSVVSQTNTSVFKVPEVFNDGSGFAYLFGQITIAANPTANMHILTLPSKVAPIVDYHIPITMLRSGAAVSNAILVETGVSTITNVVIDDPGLFQSVPTVTATQPGIGADLQPVMNLRLCTPVSVGTGYAINDTITLAGGTSTSTAQVQVTATGIATAVLENPGEGYSTGDVIVTQAIGGTVKSNGNAQMTVSNLRVVSLVKSNSGTGYKANDTIVLEPAAGTTYTEKPVIQVLSVSGGAISTYVIINGGNFTTKSLTFTQDTTSGTGSGAVFTSAVYGINEFTISNPGLYTVNPTSLVQGSTTGGGTSASFNMLTFGVSETKNILGSGGAYTATPASPVSQASTSGSGTGATFTAIWGVKSVNIIDSGEFYTSQSQLLIYGGGQFEPASGSVVVGYSNRGFIRLINAPQVGDVILLNTPPMLLLPDYAGLGSGG